MFQYSCPLGRTSSHGYVHFHLDRLEGSLVYAKTWAHDVRFFILWKFLYIDKGSHVQRHANYAERWNIVFSNHLRCEFDEHSYLLRECTFVENQINAFSNVRASCIS